MSVCSLVGTMLCLLVSPAKLLADDAEESVAPQILAARENALAWWRDPENYIQLVQSIHTTPHGMQQRSIVFILRDPQGRSLAVGYAGSDELQYFFEQQCQERIQAISRRHAPTEQQIAKLKLAADGDIARFRRRVQEAEQYLNDTKLEESVGLAKQCIKSLAEDCENGLFANRNSLFNRVGATLFTTK